MKDETEFDDSARSELAVWMEQYKITSAQIAARVDLQERNSYVHIVLMTGITGYLFTYWSQHGYMNLLTSEVAVLLVIVPLVSLVFLWRHVDHNMNMLDYAHYIADRIRPRVETLVGRDILGFEEFLQTRRRDRMKRLRGLPGLGNDATLILISLAPYLIFGWFLNLKYPGRAGSARGVFDSLLYFDSVFLVVTVFTVIHSANRFQEFATID